MLGLKLETDPRWVNIVEKNISEILTDHAYCEQKAATNALSIMISYPYHTDLVVEMVKLAKEELTHFELVHQKINERGLALGFERKDEYVGELYKFMRKGHKKEIVLIDRLLFGAMIEARSCERFRLLSLNISDEALKSFYHQFMVSEAGHFKLFLELAAHYSNAEISRKRWLECLEFEAALLQNMDARGDRMH